MKKPKPKVDKKKLIEAIRKKISETELPKELQYRKEARIIDLPKFFDSHLAVIEAQDGRLAEAYGGRLKEVLKKVGIDVNELAKEIIKNK